MLKMSADTDSKTSEMTNLDKTLKKEKTSAEAKRLVSEWTECVCELIASKLQALSVSC